MFRSNFLFQNLSLCSNQLWICSAGPYSSTKLSTWPQCIVLHRTADHTLFFFSFYSSGHGLRTPKESFFRWNPEILGLGRQIGQINSGTFGEFSTKLSTPILVQWVLPCPCFFIIQPLFLQEIKPLYPHPKYLFGIWIQI